MAASFPFIYREKFLPAEEELQQTMAYSTSVLAALSTVWAQCLCSY